MVEWLFGGVIVAADLGLRAISASERGLRRLRGRKVADAGPPSAIALNVPPPDLAAESRDETSHHVPARSRR
jgi:hypothetical protein